MPVRMLRTRQPGGRAPRRWERERHRSGVLQHHLPGPQVVLRVRVPAFPLVLHSRYRTGRAERPQRVRKRVQQAGVLRSIGHSQH